jgi:glycosyltransferase 2 family protein
MRKYRKQIIIGLAIALAIYIILLIFLDSGKQFDEDVLDAIMDFPIWLVLILCLTQISAGIFRFFEWHYYLGVIDARDKISLKDSVIIFVASFTMVVSPGKAAEALKSVLLKMKTDVPVAVSVPIVLAERIVDGLAVVVTLTVALLIASTDLQLDNLPAPLTTQVIQGIVFMSAALIAGGLIVVQIAPLAYFCLDIVNRILVFKRLHQPLIDFYESSREIFKLKHIIPTTLMGIGVYLSSTGTFLLILWGFDLHISWTLFFQVLFIVGVASAIGALSFVPNGAGVTEVSNLAMLTAIIGPSNPELTASVAAAAALMQGFFHKWFRVVVGMAVAFVYRERLFTSELDSELAAIENGEVANNAHAAGNANYLEV